MCLIMVFSVVKVLHSGEDSLAFKVPPFTVFHKLYIGLQSEMFCLGFFLFTTSFLFNLKLFLKNNAQITFMCNGFLSYSCFLLTFALTTGLSSCSVQQCGRKSASHIVFLLDFFVSSIKILNTSNKCLHSQCIPSFI